jgi:hypothetical protein
MYDLSSKPEMIWIRTFIIWIRTFIIVRSKEETGIRKWLYQWLHCKTKSYDTNKSVQNADSKAQINEWRNSVARRFFARFTRKQRREGITVAFWIAFTSSGDYWQHKSQINEDRKRLTVSSHWSQFAYPTINLSGKGMLLRLLLDPLVKLSEVEWKRTLVATTSENVLYWRENSMFECVRKINMLHLLSLLSVSTLHLRH